MKNPGSPRKTYTFSTLATFTTKLLAHLQGYRRVTVDLTVLATGDPQGQIYLTCGGDPDNLIDMPIEEDKVLTDDATGLVHTFSTSPTIIDVNDPAAEAHASITIVELPPVLGVRYVRDSGGNAAGLVVGVTPDPF